MAINKSTLSSKVWSPLQLWLLSLTLSLAGLLNYFFGDNLQVSFILVLASFLLYAAGNPILNVIRANMWRNILWSIPLFILHAVLTYFLIELINHEDKIIMKKIFSTIIVFYIMATTLSMFFRAIYNYMSEN